MIKKTTPKDWNGCRNCKHLKKGEGGKCTAYPQKIPFEFISGNIPHLFVHDDQAKKVVWELDANARKL